MSTTFFLTAKKTMALRTETGGLYGKPTKLTLAAPLADILDQIKCVWKGADG